jgi:hypothetical protein
MGQASVSSRSDRSLNTVMTRSRRELCLGIVGREARCPVAGEASRVSHLRTASSFVKSFETLYIFGEVGVRFFGAACAMGVAREGGGAKLDTTFSFAQFCLEKVSSREQFRPGG